MHITANTTSRLASVACLALALSGAVGCYRSHELTEEDSIRPAQLDASALGERDAEVALPLACHDLPWSASGVRLDVGEATREGGTAATPIAGSGFSLVTIDMDSGEQISLQFVGEAIRPGADLVGRQAGIVYVSAPDDPAHACEFLRAPHLLVCDGPRPGTWTLGFAGTMRGVLVTGSAVIDAP